MKLNECNINELIIQSRKKFNFKKWLTGNLMAFGLSIALTLLVAQVVNSVSFLAIGACILSKAAIELGAWAIPTYKANQKLRKLVNKLRQDGIKINCLSLKKAKMGTKVPERVITERAVFNVTENVTVFQDNLGDLKALRQVRSELVREFQKNQEQIVMLGDYTEIIEDSKAAEKILSMLKRR